MEQDVPNQRYTIIKEIGRGATSRLIFIFILIILYKIDLKFKILIKFIFIEDLLLIEWKQSVRGDFFEIKL